MDTNDEAVKKEEEQQPSPKQEAKTEDSGASAEPDWKELLQIERQRAEKAERDRDNYKEGMLSYKRRTKHEEPDEESAEEETLDDKIAKGLQKAIAPLTEALTINKVDSILSSVVADASKREYVKTLYQTRVQKTGTSDEAVRSDLETALAIAESKTFAKENSELKRMNDNRTYVPPNTGGGSSDTKDTKKPHGWTPQQEEALEARARSAGIPDLDKFKETAWKQFQSGKAFDVQKKYIP